MQPLFLPAAPAAAGGQRFAVLHRPQGTATGLVVFAPPFAEEMNKSRRMVGLQARALAAHGLAVLVPDLRGCGDSADDFGDADWSDWVDDVVQAAGWLRHQACAWSASPAASPPPLTLWGLRAGALLAAEAAARLGDVQRLLLWQPALSGKTVLNQFLRLQLAGELLSGDAAGGTQALRQRLTDGHSVELAGYRLSPGLALGLERAQLQPSPAVREVHWLDVSPRPGADLAPASAKAAAAWREAGVDVRAQRVSGPAFWQTTEIEDAPRLIDATLAALAAAASENQPAAAAA